MGRKIMRVPLDFKWPNEVWGGYLNPYSDKSRTCPDCDGTGGSPRSNFLSAQWYGKVPFDPGETGSVPLQVTDAAVWAFASRNIERSPSFFGNGDDAITREAHRLVSMWNHQWSHHLCQEDVDALIEGGRLMDFTHTWERETGWTKIEPTPVVTPQMINEWSLRGIGHDSINQWVCVRARCKREGVETSCLKCEGKGCLYDDPQDEILEDAWKPFDPPTGEGWQLWETVSEGSPTSPVFDSPSALADWCVDNATIFATEKLSRRQWLQMIVGEEDLDMGSMMIAGEGFVGSVAAFREKQRDEADQE